MANSPPPDGHVNAPEHPFDQLKTIIAAQANGEQPPLGKAETLALLDSVGPKAVLYAYTNLNADPNKPTLEFQNSQGFKDTLGELHLTDDARTALAAPRSNVYVGNRLANLSFAEARRQKEAGTIVADAMRNDTATLKAIDHLNGKTHEVDAEGKPVLATKEDLDILQKGVIKNLPKLDELTATIQLMREQGARYTGINDSEPQGARVSSPSPDAPLQR